MPLSAQDAATLQQLMGAVTGFGNIPTLKAQEDLGIFAPTMQDFTNQPTLSYEQQAGNLFNGPAAGNPAPGGQLNPGYTLDALKQLGTLQPGINGFFQNTPGGSANAAAIGNLGTLDNTRFLGDLSNSTAQLSGFMPGGFKNGTGEAVPEATIRAQLAANGFNPTTMSAAELANAYNVMNGYQGQQLISPANGAPTLGEQQLQANTGTDLLKLLSSLQSNPFQMEQVARGANSMGLSNSLSSLTGLIPNMPSFQAYGQPQSPSLQAAMSYLGQTGGSASSPQANSGAIGMPLGQDGTAPLGSTVGGVLNNTAGPAQLGGLNADANIAALQSTPVNKWSPQAYFQAIQSESGKNFVNSALQAAGLSPSDVENTMKNLLPSFQTPRFGSVNSGGSIANAASGA